MKVSVVTITVNITKNQDYFCLVLLCLNPHRTTRWWYSITITKRINLTALLMAQEAQGKEEAIGSSSTSPPVMESAPPPWRVIGTGSSYNPMHPSSHFLFWPPPTSSSDSHLWSVTPSGDLTWTQYFDLLALSTVPSPPSSPDSLPADSSCSSVHIDPLTNENDDDMEIKVALHEEFSGETRDANRWLMAM